LVETRDKPNDLHWLKQEINLMTCIQFLWWILECYCDFAEDFREAALQRPEYAPLFLAYQQMNSGETTGNALHGNALHGNTKDNGTRKVNATEDKDEEKKSSTGQDKDEEKKSSTGQDKDQEKKSSTGQNEGQAHCAQGHLKAE